MEILVREIQATDLQASLLAVRGHLEPGSSRRAVAPGLWHETVRGAATREERRESQPVSQSGSQGVARRSGDDGARREERKGKEQKKGRAKGAASSSWRTWRLRLVTDRGRENN